MTGRVRAARRDAAAAGRRADVAAVHGRRLRGLLLARGTTRRTSAGSSGRTPSRCCRTGRTCRSATTAAPARSSSPAPTSCGRTASAAAPRRPAVRPVRAAGRRGRGRLRVRRPGRAPGADVAGGRARLRRGAGQRLVGARHPGAGSTSRSARSWASRSPRRSSAWITPLEAFAVARVPVPPTPDHPRLRLPGRGPAVGPGPRASTSTGTAPSCRGRRSGDVVLVRPAARAHDGQRRDRAAGRPVRVRHRVGPGEGPARLLPGAVAGAARSRSRWTTAPRGRSSRTATRWCITATAPGEDGSVVGLGRGGRHGPPGRRPTWPGRSAVHRSGSRAAKESSLTLERGLALLQAVADAESEAPTISELADGDRRQSGPRSTGCSVPLQARGLVRREGSKVRLGLGVLRLASNVLPQLRMAAHAGAARAGRAGRRHRAPDGRRRRARPRRSRWSSRRGRRSTWRTGWVPDTRCTVARPARRSACARRRRAGSVDAGELQPGAYGVAAPVRGVPGLRASVGVVALEKLDADVVGPQVIRAAEAVAAALRCG